MKELYKRVVSLEDSDLCSLLHTQEDKKSGRPDHVLDVEVRAGHQAILQNTTKSVMSMVACAKTYSGLLSMKHFSGFKTLLTGTGCLGWSGTFQEAKT